MNNINIFYDKVYQHRFQLICLWLAGCLSFFLYHVLQGWNHSLDDQHGFRQTQTAITAYYFIKEGFKIEYITPILGPPWSIPMEFPTYQYIVAFVVKLTGSPLDQTGRGVSLTCFLSSIIVAYYLLRELRFSQNKSLFLVSILLLDPVYMFWARTFMIETTVLFFSLLFAYYSVKSIHQANKGSMLLTFLFGSIAGSTKVTTFAVFLGAVILYYVYTIYQKQQKLTLNMMMTGLAIILPVVISYCWVLYSDMVKSENMQGIKLTSASLSGWNYGTFDQKTSPDIWKQIIDNSLMIVKFIVPCLFFYKLRYWTGFIFLLIIWLSGPLLFTNLYYVHNYYASANSLFMSLATGLILLSVLISSSKWIRLAGLVLLPLICYKMYGKYLTSYKASIELNDTFSKTIGQNIQKNIPENEIIIVFGDDWNSRMPYYSERKTIMWRFISDNAQFLEAYIQLLGDRNKIGGVFVLDHIPAQNSQIYGIIQTLNLNTNPVFLDPNTTGGLVLYKR